ncbi:MAG TPA: hypothetical protein VNN80_20715, partial [Polyangiaceae bacterium]|nr:hypothetical protein [Polyangiaceae bacterium]
ARDEHGVEHEEHAEGLNLMSLKLAGLELVVPGEEGAGSVTEPESSDESSVLRRVGISLGYERVLIEGWLEAELNVLFAPGSGGLTLPVDLLLKTPFELGSSFEASIGVGLATEWLTAGEAETAYGVASQLGGYYWVDPRFAVVLEAEYSLLVQPETAHEFVLASGGAFRF